jgi:hypothetical protein
MTTTRQKYGSPLAALSPGEKSHETGEHAAGVRTGKKVSRFDGNHR